jgi:hypothetical protein
MQSVNHLSDKDLNLQCMMLKDMLSINDPESAEGHKYHASIVELRPSKGRVFNSLKMRDGFLNRVNLVKEEIKFQELQAKGKRRVRPGVTEDPKYISL